MVRFKKKINCETIETITLTIIPIKILELSKRTKKFAFLLPLHSMKSVRIWSYSGPHFPHSDRIWRGSPYLSVFSPNPGKYGPE